MIEFLGDQPALDMMNTVVQGEETWQSDADVMAWLAAAGQLPCAGAKRSAPPWWRARPVRRWSWAP